MSDSIDSFVRFCSAFCTFCIKRRLRVPLLMAAVIVMKLGVLERPREFATRCGLDHVTIGFYGRDSRMLCRQPGSQIYPVWRQTTVGTVSEATHGRKEIGRCHCVGVRCVVKGINVSQIGKPTNPIKGTVSLTTVNCSTMTVDVLERMERIVLEAATSVSEYASSPRRCCQS